METSLISSAANTLAPAWLVLRERGYVVSKATENGRLLRAEKDGATLVAEDTLLLLGLAALAEARGASSKATDEEISSYLQLFES